MRRGVGFAVGFKNIGFSEGFDDYSTARVRLADGAATVTCACAEIGQGFVTLAQQITREVLGVDEVVLAPADTSIGSAGSTSASRQTWISGGAVQAAAEAVRQRLLERVAQVRGVDPEHAGARRRPDPHRGDRRRPRPRSTCRWPRPAPGSCWRRPSSTTTPPPSRSTRTARAHAHLAFAFAAHRAVVDVDPELGLVRLVDLTTSQEVGRVLNPLQLLGQLEGGAAQGVGLAVMEEIVVDDGLMRNPSFTDYLIPTALDLPELSVAAVIEEPEPGAPFGAKGVGEPPTISSGAAVVGAIRAATGLDLARVPVRPYDIALASAPRGRPRERASTDRLRIDRSRLLGRLDALGQIGRHRRRRRLPAGPDRRRRGRARPGGVVDARPRACGCDIDGIGNVVGTWPADRFDPPGHDRLPHRHGGHRRPLRRQPRRAGRPRGASRR